MRAPTILVWNLLFATLPQCRVRSLACPLPQDFAVWEYAGRTRQSRQRQDRLHAQALADIILSFLRHHWCWRFRKQVSVIWVPADFYEHLIQNTHKWKHYFCKTKVNSPKQKTYDSYQRFEVSKIAVLDSGFRRTKAEVCHFQASCLLCHYGANEDEGKITYQSFPIDFGTKINLVFQAFTVVRFSIQPALSRVANWALLILL